jgi:hypothetical protein
MLTVPIVCFLGHVALFLFDKITNVRTIILPVVLYGRETLSLTLSKEHRLRVFGPLGGRSTEWTQLDSTPHYTN